MSRLTAKASLKSLKEDDQDSVRKAGRWSSKKWKSEYNE